MADTHDRPHLFCISTYEKGQTFMRAAVALGCDVSLLTVNKLRDADWPHEVLREFHTMPEELTPEQVLHTVLYLARTRRIDRVVALDEFDLEAAALLREHMRLPGMGQSATRFFRDKLAMRTQAHKAGIAVPEFTGVFNDQDLAAWMRAVPSPWLLKPRSNASAIGIKRIERADELWPVLEALGDARSRYLLERFMPGEVFHVEGVTSGGKLLFRAPCKYGRPPIETMHTGGVFTTRTLALDTHDARALDEIHERLIPALGLVDGVTHTEFIKSHADGRFLFLESAARVGGAYIAEVIELATGLNPWVEWARMETGAVLGVPYRLPSTYRDFAGSVISLARQEWPDTAGYTDPEIALRISKHHHAVLLLRSESEARLGELLGRYAGRFLEDFNAVIAAPEKPM